MKLIINIHTKPPMDNFKINSCSHLENQMSTICYGSKLGRPIVELMVCCHICNKYKFYCITKNIVIQQDNSIIVDDKFTINFNYDGSSEQLVSAYDKLRLYFVQFTGMCYSHEINLETICRNSNDVIDGFNKILNINKVMVKLIDQRIS